MYIGIETKAEFAKRLEGSWRPNIADSLAPLPIRGTLFEKRADTFSDVLRILDPIEGSSGQSPTKLIAARRPLVDGPERFLNGDWRVAQDTAGEFQCAGEGGTRFCQMIDETCGVGAFRADRVAGQDQLASEVERQSIGRAKQGGTGRKNTDRDLWQSKASRTRRDDEITGEHDLETATQRRALDACDEWLAPHATNDAVLTTALGNVVTIAGEIASGTENRIAPFEHARPERIVVVELIERRIDLIRHLSIDGVAFGFPTHRDDQQMLLPPSFDARLI